MSLIIVDGYNLIRQSRVFSDIEDRNFEKGRTALVQALSAYKNDRPHRIVVVFDAWNTDWQHRGADRIGGVEILYSRSGETADEVILELLGHEKGDIIVVSSDRQIADGARRAGHLVMAAPDFEQTMRQALYQAGEPSEAPEPVRGRLTTEKKGPSRRLPKAKRRAIERTRKL